MDVDVRLDGVSIGERDSRLSGHRSIGIGADRWIALGSPRAYGGCSIALANGDGDGLRTIHFLTSLPLTLFALIALRRKRRKRNLPTALQRRR
jgi:hypothetical protein